MKKTILLCACTLVIAAGIPAFAQKNEPKGKGSTEVIVSSVIQDDFSDQVEALGTTKSNESVIITADRSEKISAIHFEEGQIVKKGDLLVTLDKIQEEAELRASEAFTAERQNAYDRAKSLSGNSALPKATLQERLAELKQSQAETEAIKASLESYEIRAPFDGIIGLREVSVGALIQPGDMITTIDDISQIKVDFDVPSVFLSALKPGLPIAGYIEAFGDREFKGDIQTINTQIDPLTRTVKVRAILPNEDGLLKPGLLMSLELSKNLRQALLIPEEALLKRSDKNFVFLAVNQNEKTIAKQTEIILGVRKPGVIEVLSGLQKGDQVITHGIVKLRDGAEIFVRARENTDAPLHELLKQTQPASGE